MRYCYSLKGDQFQRMPDLDGAAEVGFELRLDSLAQAPDAAALRAITKAPLLATFRTKPHLGLADTSLREHQGWAWRMVCLEAGFEWIDLELDEPDLDAKIEIIQKAGGRVVLSHHDLETGASLPSALDHALRTKADILKIIGTGQSSADLLQQRHFYAKAGTRALVHFFMGSDFAATRILSLVLDAPFTFLAPDPQLAVAPGQLDFEEVTQVYRPLEVDLKQLQLFAVLGKPIGHSRSPAFHNPLLKTIDPHALFLALPAASEADFARVFEAWPELRACAITKPLKEIAFARASRYLDPLTPLVQASNTLIKEGDSFAATNTDLLAMVDLLSKEPKGTLVRILGYGGLGKAVAIACHKLGIPVEVCNRTAGKVQDPQIKELPWEQRHQPGSTMIVQATSVGMAPCTDQSPLDFIPPDVTHVLETIYNPNQTKLVQMAQTAGLRTTLGHALFDGQAQHQATFFREVCLANLVGKP